MCDCQSHSEKLISTDPEILRETTSVTVKFFTVFFNLFTLFRLLICTIELAELKRVSLMLYLGIHPAETSTAVEFQAFLFPSRLFLINDPPKKHTLGFLNYL